MPSPLHAPLHDERLTLVGLLIETNAGLTARLGRHLETTFGLSPQWFEVLLRLVRTPGGRLRMADLAAQTTLTSSGLTRVIDRLEDAGLVQRELCPSDRRGSFAVLTDEGRARIEAALPPHIEQLQEHFAGVLSDGERKDLEAILRKLRDHLHPCAVAGAGAAEPCPGESVG